jgi:6-phosphogluconolactonase
LLSSNAHAVDARSPTLASKEAMMADVEIFSDRDALIRAEAERIVKLLRNAIAARGRCVLSLSGGATPKPLYQLLATPPYAGRIDWSRVHLFWGDERCVPPDHPESNYRMTREALLDRVTIPSMNVHRIRGEDDPEQAAAAYERLLRQTFGPQDPPARSFDVVLLGMGPDGHTASMFPGTAAPTETQRWAMAVHLERPREMWRVTLTTVVLNAAADVTFLVAGADKAPRLREVLEARGERSLPVQRIQPAQGTLHWMVDAAAAAQLHDARP